MYHVRRLLLSRVGAANPEYRGKIFDFTDHVTGLPTETVLHGTNGAGKTTAMSLMISVFEPEQHRFIQHVQRPQSHHYTDYLRDRPGVVAVELEASGGRRPGVRADRVVVGYVAECRAKDGKLRRFFFSFRSIEGFTLDDIPWAGTSVPRADCVGVWDAAVRWRNEWTASYPKTRTAFYHTDTIRLWTDHLRHMRVPVDLIATQVDMARAEGGLENLFKKISAQGDALPELVDMLGLGEHAQATYVEELNKNVVAWASKGAHELEIAVAERLLETVGAVTAADDARIGADAHAQAESEALAVIASRLRRNGIDAERRFAEAARAVDEARGDALRHDQDRRAGLVRADAFRTLSAERDLRDVRGEVGRLDGRKRRAETVVAGMRVAGSVRALLAAQGSVDAAVSSMELVHMRHEEAVAPVKVAGSALAACIDGLRAVVAERRVRAQAEMEAAERDRQTAESERARLNAERKDVANSLANHKAASARRDALTAQARTDGLVLRGEAVEAADFRHVERLSAAFEALEEAEDAVTAANDVKTATAGARGEAIADARAAEATERMRTEALRARTSALAVAAADNLFAVLGIRDPDPTSGDLLREVRARLAEAADRVRANQAMRTDLAGRLQAHEDGRDCQSQSVKEVLDRLERAGLTASHAPIYVREIVHDPEQAKAVVESDLGRMYHGVMVEDLDDLGVVSRLFDREEWRLDDPVIVSLTSTDVRPAPGGQVVLSAWKDRAYSVAASQRYREELDAQVNDLDRQSGDAIAHRDRLEVASGILTRSRDEELRLPLSTLESDLAAAVSERERTASDLRRINDAAATAGAAVDAACRVRDERKRAHAKGKADLEEVRMVVARVQERRHQILTPSEEARHMADAQRLAQGELALDLRVKALIAARTEAETRRSAAAVRLDTLANDARRITYRNADPVEAPTGVDPEAAHARAREVYDQLEVALAEKGTVGELRGAEARHRAAVDGRQRAEEALGRTRRTEAKGLSLDEVDAAAAEVRDLDAEDASRRESDAKAEVARVEAERTELARREGVLIGEAKPRPVDGVDAAEERSVRSAVAAEVGEDGSVDLDAAMRAATAAADASASLCAAARAVVEERGRETVARRAAASAAELLLVDLGGPDGHVDEQGLSGDEADWRVEVKAAKARRDAALDACRSAVARLGREKARLAEAASAPEVQGTSVKMRSLCEGLGGWLRADALMRGRERDIVEGLQGTIQGLTHALAELEPAQESLRHGLGSLLRDALSRFHAATHVSIPDQVPQFGGKIVLRCKPEISKLQRIGTVAAVEAFVSNVLKDSANAEQGLRISGKELVVALMRCTLPAVAERRFEFEILSPVAQTSDTRYERLTAVGGSGGQVLTSALMLYLVLANVRAGRNQGAVFLMLDNPLGQASASILVNIQIGLARALGVQLIVTSGVTVMQAIRQFPNIIGLRATRGTLDPRAGGVEVVNNEVWSARHALAPVAA